MRLAVTCVLAVLLCVPASAELVKDVSTGFDNATGVVIEGGQPDPDYTISPGNLTATVLPEAWPVAPGVWLANSDTSKWVGFEAESSNADPGDYDFTTTVMLEGVNPATAVLTGAWATDNSGLDILVNGVSTGTTNTGDFTVMHPFLNVGSGLFQEGANTITFRFNNAAGDPPVANPAGLRVEAGVYASAVQAPFDFTIYNTGVGDDGVPLADNAVDPHWTLSGTGAAEGQGPDGIVTRESGGFPIGPWLLDSADTSSGWVTPAADASGPGATDGTAIYEFSTAFTTPIGGTATISGLQSADNGVVDVQIDGVSGTFTPVGFNTFGDFSVTADITGTEHTLSFFVHNGTGEATPDGPVGLRVHIESAEFVPIPEPSTVALGVLGLLSLALYGWRRKR